MIKKPLKTSERKKLMKQLEKECMDLWQQVVKLRANYKCFLSGEKGVVHAHHIFHKRNYPALRYNPNNGVCLSQGQHFKVHNCGEAELIGVLTAKRGQYWHDTLMDINKRNPQHKYTVELLQDIKIGLETMLKELK